MFSLVSRRSIAPSRVLAFRLMSSSSSKGDKKFRPQHETVSPFHSSFSPFISLANLR